MRLIEIAHFSDRHFWHGGYDKASLEGGTPTIANNDYWGPAGVRLNPSPDASRSTVNPAFTSPSTGDYHMTGGAGIGFVPIDQTQIGVAPAGPLHY